MLPTHEIVVNLHMHTRYSDGHGSHAEIAAAGLEAGLDAVIVTDHNVLAVKHEGYLTRDRKRLLMLIGEEVHDQARTPQKNHLLIFGAGRELAPLAADPQRLIDSAREAGGLPFIAHPVDPANPAFKEADLSWESWEVERFTGIELWNAMTELKTYAQSLLAGAWYALNPDRVARGPLPQTVQRWDDLLRRGRKVVAIGGSDAHALPMRLGPLRRVIFPYAFHFRCVNTHLLLPEPLTGRLETDRTAVYTALRQGAAFIGYDLPASTRGFRFTAQGEDAAANLGGEIPLGRGVTLQVRLPERAECLLLKDGAVIKTWLDREICTFTAREPGVYRVEVYRPFRGRRRAWIFSNPIYVQS